MLSCCVDYSMFILWNDLAGSSSGFFQRSWSEYQQGFGSPMALYWIGLDRLHNVTRGNCQARFELQATGGTWHYAQYSSFSVGDSSTNYTLTIGGWSGDTGYDAMAWCNGRQFTTYDADNDGRVGGNCAIINGGGFWYPWCGDAHLTTSTSSGLFFWYTPTGTIYLNAVEVYLLC